MKKQTLLISTVLILCIALLCSSCQSENDTVVSTTKASEKSYDLIIRELEEKILELEQNHYISQVEREREIAELKDKIAKLNDESAENTVQTTSSLADSIFTYEMIDSKLMITGFTGKDEHIVIPSEIDGTSVYGIDDSAFEGYPIRSVIISDGVEYIDWFAFYNCPKLTAITLPSSINKIGYSAFDGASKTFTIYCHGGSFAQSYAQSYGITYALI